VGQDGDEFPLFAVPEEGLPEFDAFQVSLDELEREVREILWPVVDHLGELEEGFWIVEGTLEKASLRTIVRVAAVELNRHGVLADGTPPVTLAEGSATCYVPEGCTGPWRETVVWHAVLAAVSSLSEEVPSRVSDRLRSQARPKLERAWTVLAENLGVDMPAVNEW